MNKKLKCVWVTMAHLVRTKKATDSIETLTENSQHYENESAVLQRK